MRGRNALAVALRHPDGSIVWATERLDLGLRARRAMKLPFLRGLVVLYDTLVTGTRWLVRSATLQALAAEEAERKGATGRAAWPARPREPAARPGRCCTRSCGCRSCRSSARRPTTRRVPRTPAPVASATPIRTRSARARRPAPRKASARATPSPSAACCWSPGLRHRDLLPAAAVPGPGHRRARGPGLRAAALRGRHPRRHLHRLPAARVAGAGRAPHVPVPRRRAHVDPHAGGRRPADRRGGPQVPDRPSALRHRVPGRRPDRLDPGLRRRRQAAAAVAGRLARRPDPGHRRDQLRAPPARARAIAATPWSAGCGRRGSGSRRSPPASRPTT